MDNSKSNLFNETTRNIAYLLLTFFGLFLAISVLGYFMDSQSSKEGWLEIFRNGFIFLSGLLTTIIGYYFGNKNAAEAERNVQIAREDVQTMKNTVAVLEERSAPTNEAYDLEIPSN